MLDHGNKYTSYYYIIILRLPMSCPGGLVKQIGGWGEGSVSFFVWLLFHKLTSLTFSAILFQSAASTSKRTKRDGSWSGFAWTGFSYQSSVILWVKKYPNTTHPWRVHMELTLKSMEIIWLVMDHFSWTMEASTTTGGILKKTCIFMITELEQLKTWLNFILSRIWPSLQVTE